jgi:hypothetical protein
MLRRTKFSLLIVWPFLIYSVGGTVASGAVLEVTPAGFAVREEVTTTASPKAVYAAILHGVGKWWNSAHTYSGDARNLSIDAKVGGCFCERIAHGGGVEHARVIALLPDSLVRVSGAFGPLQPFGLAGTLSWRMTGTPAGTKIELSYNVGGYLPGGFENIAAGVDEVLGDQLNRLKSFSETGKP